jgi:hypothetical protein
MFAIRYLFPEIRDEVPEKFPKRTEFLTCLRIAAATLVSASAALYSCSRRAVIRVHDDAGNVIETHEHAGDFKEW